MPDRITMQAARPKCPNRGCGHPLTWEMPEHPDGDVDGAWWCEGPCNGYEISGKALVGGQRWVAEQREEEAAA